MNDPIQRDGLIAVMMQRFETRWLPDTLHVKEKIDRGEVLSDWAARFLEEVIEEIRQAQALVDHYPEFQHLYARVARLYQEITTQALENEAAS